MMMGGLGRQGGRGDARSWRRAVIYRVNIGEALLFWRESVGLTGSKIPAPGHTISAPPNSLLAISNIRSNCAQSLTSVS